MVVQPVASRSKEASPILSPEASLSRLWDLSKLVYLVLTYPCPSVKHLVCLAETHFVLFV